MKKTQQKYLAVPSTKTKQLFVWQHIVGLLNHSFWADMQSSSGASLLACHNGHKPAVACAPRFSFYSWGIVSAAVHSLPLHELSEHDYSLLVVAHHPDYHCRHYWHSRFYVFEILPEESRNQKLSNFLPTLLASHSDHKDHCIMASMVLRHTTGKYAAQALWVSYAESCTVPFLLVLHCECRRSPV